MAYGFRLRVWGDYACFTRPEMKVERVSYDVMTPSAARGVMSAIYWKPEIDWLIDRIHVLRPIQFTHVRRNEVGVVASTRVIEQAMKNGDVDPGIIADDERVRQQRAAMVLRDVDYVIEAHFEASEGSESNPAKHADTFRRRATRGQCFHRPYLGTREFAAFFELLDGEIPRSPFDGTLNLGWMLYDIDFARDNTPMFFRAELQNGILDVARARQDGLIR